MLIYKIEEGYWQFVAALKKNALKSYQSYEVYSIRILIDDTGEQCFIKPAALPILPTRQCQYS